MISDRLLLKIIYAIIIGLIVKNFSNSMIYFIAATFIIFGILAIENNTIVKEIKTWANRRINKTKYEGLYLCY